jgi:hypothetical protein
MMGEDEETIGGGSSNEKRAVKTARSLRYSAGSDPDPETDTPTPAPAAVVPAPILATAITAPTPPAMAAPVASPHILCELEAFFRSLAVLRTLAQIFEIGKDARPGRRIIRRKAYQCLGLGRQNNGKRARARNPKQTLHKHSSIHHYLLLAMFHERRNCNEAASKWFQTRGCRSSEIRESSGRPSQIETESLWL